MPLDLATARLLVNPAAAGNPTDRDKLYRAFIEGDLEGENRLSDLRARSYMHDDFLAALIDARWSATAGGGAGAAAATTVAGAVNGEITMTTSSANAAHSANNSQLTTDQLNYKANQGGLFIEARIKIDVITAAYIFVGFTDVISTTVECPIFMTAADLDSDADNAAGMVYDTAATNDYWHVGGVKATVDTVPLNSQNAPVAATYQTIRVEIDASGAVTGYINGGRIGTVSNAITVTTALTPCISVGNNAAETKILSVDYIAVGQTR